MAAILSTSFAAPVTDWAASWSLVSVTGVQVGHLCSAESELAQVTKVGPGTTIQVRRGVEGTAVAAHAASTPVAIYRAGDVETGPDPMSAATVSLRQASVILTHAQILALPSSPVLLVPAPGATKVLLPVSGMLVGTIPISGYTGINTASAKLSIQWTDFIYVAGGLQNRTTPALSDLTTFLAGPERWTLLMLGLARNVGAFSSYGLPVTTFGLPVNHGLQLAAYDDSSTEWTGGAVGNTLTVTVLYGIFDMSTGVWV